MAGMSEAKTQEQLASDIAYYETHARAYADATRQIDLSRVHQRFLAYVEAHGQILDVGSGSGRDTRAFIDHGYAVDAIEPSAALAWRSMQFTGVKPRSIRVQELTDEARYDGIWACASLVHVPLKELPGVFSRLARAARPAAAIYLSFKVGSGDRYAVDGRLFTDLDEADLRALVEGTPNLKLAEVWFSGGEGIAQGRDKWINAILLKD